MEGEGEESNLGIGDRVYTEDDIIKLRKIRDTLGVVWKNPKLNDAEQEIIRQSVINLVELPGVATAGRYHYRGLHADTQDSWEAFL